MNRWLLFFPVLGVLAAAYWLFSLPSQAVSATSVAPPTAAAYATAKVVRAPMAVWSTYLGRLEPRTPHIVMSPVRSSATVVELVAEGTTVRKGDVLARLNSATAERDVVKSEKDYAVAEAELNGYKNAKAPLELQDLLMKVAEARSSYNAENQYLQAMLPLAREGLVSSREIDRQKDKVAELRTLLDKSEAQSRLTGEYLHPAELRRLQARLSAAAAELKIARQEVQQSVISAPSAGVVIYTPLYFGPELRNVRIGDSVNPNQPFMTLYDMKDLVVQCEVPESELEKVQAGTVVAVQPLAYPEMRLNGIIEQVSPVVVRITGRPEWQKSFSIVVRLKVIDSRLRPGMSVTAYVLSYHASSALLVPRVAVSWDNGAATVNVMTGSLAERRRIKLGRANDMNYEVREGLTAGETVLLQ